MFKLIIKTPERRQWRLGSPFRKNNTIFANLPVAPFFLNVLQIFQIFVHSVFVYWLVWFYLRIKTFTNFSGIYVFVYVVIFGISVDLISKMTKRKCEKKCQS